jgi:hypothetical protein
VPALDDDVHTAVRQHLQHLDDRGARPDVVEVAARLREDDPELLLALEGLADELLVPRLEHVQRHPLRPVTCTSSSGKRPILAMLKRTRADPSSRVGYSGCRQTCLGGRGGR